MNNYFVFSTGEYLNGKYLIRETVDTTDTCQIYVVTFMGKNYLATVWDDAGLEKSQLPLNPVVVDSFNMNWRGERYTVFIRPDVLEGTVVRLEDYLENGRWYNYWEDAASTIHDLATWLLKYKEYLHEEQSFDFSLGNMIEYATCYVEIITCPLDVHSGMGKSQDEYLQVNALARLLVTLLTGDTEWVPSASNADILFWLDCWNEERKVFVIQALGLDPTVRMDLQTFTDTLGRMCNEQEPVGGAKDKESVNVLGQVDCNIEFKRCKKGRGGFQDVAGMTTLKQELKRDVLFTLEHPEQAEKYRLKPLNGMVLYGPPGCGKTYIAQKFAEESGMYFALVKGSDLANVYYHGSQSMIGDLFQKALQYTPCVICFDELDSFIYSRQSTSGDHSMHLHEVDEFLTQLNNCGQRGIFVIGTTNRLDLVDTAALRSGRLEKKVYVPLPDAESRKCLFSAALKSRPVSQINLDQLANATEGYVASDIEFIVNQVALDAAMADALITQEAILAKLKTLPSSLSEAQLKEYGKFEQAKSPTACSRPIIGFNANRA